MISICVVNWRTSEELCRLATSLSAGADGLPHELCIVDNDSGDGSLERLRAELPDAKIVAMGQNVGFGSGVNRAARETSGEYLLILNPDTRVFPGAIRALSEYLDGNDDVGLAAPRLVDPAGGRQASARRFPSASAAAFRGTPLGWLFPKNRFARTYLMEDIGFQEPTPVEWVSGSAMMLRRTAFEALGGFDEEFFMYCEDVDLCKRLWEAGWRIVYVPSAHIEHRVGASSDQAQPAMIREHHRSMLRYFSKHIRGGASGWQRMFYPLGIRLRMCLVLTRRRLVWWRSHRIGGSDRV
jgi:GT2 family glycosyltransferase